MNESSRIPVVLVTGFLGSGKTTLLRRIAESHPQWRLVFLVNEYAETSVDGDTLAATGTPTQSVVGGSLFCECKAGDFIRTMKETVLEAHRQAPLDAVIIETSGTADPEAIGCLLRDFGLDEWYELRSITTVVAPARLPRLIGNLPVVDSQLQSCDLIVINKIDTVSAPELEAVETQLKEINPTARMVRAEQCQFPFVLPTDPPQIPQAPLATCDANPFSTIETQWPRQGSIRAAQTWIESLPDEILRIKGELRTPEGSWHVERTHDGLELHPSELSPSSASNQSNLVLIAHDDHEAKLQAAIDSIHDYVGKNRSSLSGSEAS